MPVVSVTIPAFLERELWGQTAIQWIAALGAFAITLAVLPVVIRFAARRIRRLTARSDTRWDDLVIEALERTRSFFYLGLSLWVGSLALNLPPRIRAVVQIGLALVALVQIGLWCTFLIKGGIDTVVARRAQEDPAAATGLTAISVVAQLLLWVAVFLMALDNMGVDVTAFIAGLGVTGIAVALAVQNVLGDLLASISIVLDKPFVIGDFIIVSAEHMGTVEKVGLKTTRIRSLGGEQLIFSNQDLLQSRLRNYKRMDQRRVVFGFGVLYSTDAARIEAIPGLVRGIVEGVPGTRFDRAHFKAFGQSSLDFEVVYYVLSPDFNLYMDIQQTLNLSILRALRERGIEFAFPTRTLHVQGADVTEPLRVALGAEGTRERPVEA